MGLLKSFIRTVDAINEWIGRTTAWLVLGAVIVCFLVAILRYGFSIGFTWMQELYVWQHAAVFMLGAGYTMLHGGHVGVDILTSRFTERTRAWLDIISTFIFLFPWLAVIAIYSAPYIRASWAVRESSSSADGMLGLFLLKSILWVFCAILFLQGLALVARRVLFLRGYTLDPDPVEHIPPTAA
jgi:TRAP-type mannitol/chloroaromatic compound transport system permease small subunit